VSCRDKLRDLIVKLDLRLKNIEPRNRPGFETVLLIFELALKKIDGVLLHDDQLAVHDHLVELRLHRCNCLIDYVSKREVSRVPLEKRAANRAERAVVKNKLPAGDLNVVDNIAAQVFDPTYAKSARRRCWPTATSKRRNRSRVFAKIRISPLPHKVRSDMRQRFRAYLDDHALGALDLLKGAQDFGILLQGRHHRLLKRKNRRAS